MTTATPTKAEDLKRHLQNTKVVTVEDKDGKEWTFKILPVSMLAWDETKTLWKVIADDPDNFHEAIRKSVEAPTDIVVRRVIMQACQEPRITDTAEKDTVPILDFMRHDILVINLYAEIVDHSFSGLLKTEATDGGTTPTGNR